MFKPTFVCVPGAFHTAEVYSPMLKILRNGGYPAIALTLPSVGASPAHPDFLGDVNCIRDCLTHLVSEGKEVVLVAHSYGGIPTCQAPEGLSRKEREEKGLPGGVIRLVFIMAYAMPEGFLPTAAAGVAVGKFADWMKLDLEKGIMTIDREDAKRVFYNDISQEEGNKWAAKLQHQSTGVFTSTITYAAWRHIPLTYVIGTEDRTRFTPEVVKRIIDISKPDVVEKCDGGHCLMLSRPDWLAGVLRRAAWEE